MIMNFKSVISIILIPLFLLGASSCSQTADSGNREIIAGPDDLHGKNIGAVSGSVQDLYVSRNYPDNTIMRAETENDVLMMLEKNKVQAVVTSGICWKMSSAEYHNIICVCDTISPKPIGYLFNKSQKDLREKLDAFLKEFLTTGEKDIMLQHWSDPESDRRMPDPEAFDGENGTLKIAVCTISPPFSYIKNGEVSGVEVEVLARFAMSLGMKWEFIDVNFTGLIPYVQSGKAPMGAGILCITPERQQSVDFSIPWLYEASAILVHKDYAPAELIPGHSVETTSFIESIKASFYKTLIKEDRYKMLIDGLKSTILISLLAALLGTLLGILLCYFSMHRNKLLSGISNLYIEFMRCMPQVVFLMIMFYVVFGSSSLDGLWVAIIAFALCFSAYTSVIFRSAVSSIDRGQTEAALSMGFGKIKAFWHIILPQTVQRALPVYKGEFIGLVKATSIVGYIAVFDLTKAGDIIRSRTYEAFFPLIIVTILYFLVIWVLSSALKFIETKTQPTRKKFFK